MSFTDLLAKTDQTVRQKLGGTVTYTPGVGVAVEIDGVFDAAFQLATPEYEPGVATKGPAVFLTLADLPSDPSADRAARVTVDGTAYKVHVAEPDGQGGVLLKLHKV